MPGAREGWRWGTNVSALSAIDKSCCLSPWSGEDQVWGTNVSALSAVNKFHCSLPGNGDGVVNTNKRGMDQEQTWHANYHALSRSDEPQNLSPGGESEGFEANKRGAVQAQTVDANSHTSQISGGFPCQSSGGGGDVEGSFKAANKMQLGDTIVSASSAFDTSQNHVTNPLDKSQLALFQDSDSPTFHEEES